MAWVRIRERETEILQLQQYEKAVELLRSGILYERACLPELMAYLAEKMDGEVGKFFQRIAGQMEKELENGFAGVWEKEMYLLGEKIKLSGFLMDILINLGQCLGQSDRQIQMGMLQRALEEVEKDRKERAERFENEKKTSYAICSALGVMTVIILF